VIVFFGQFLEKRRSSPLFLTTFFHRKSYVFLAKKGFGLILGVFFANSSGHPDRYIACSYEKAHLSKIYFISNRVD
jgi:hypothetical protein